MGDFLQSQFGAVLGTRCLYYAIIIFYDIDKDLSSPLSLYLAVKYVNRFEI